MDVGCGKTKLLAPAGSSQSASRSSCGKICCTHCTFLNQHFQVEGHKVKAMGEVMVLAAGKGNDLKGAWGMAHH